MKRISAYIRGKVEEIKAKSREKRVYSALEAAKINFEEQIADAEILRNKLMEEIAECEDVSAIISKISELFDNIEEAERGLKRIEDIKNLFNEEVEVPEEA